MIRLVAAIAAVLLAAGCGHHRQVNAGADVPVMMVSEPHMLEIVKQRRPDVERPGLVLGFHSADGIRLRDDMHRDQENAMLLHEFVHLLVDIDPATEPAAVEALRRVDGDGFRTGHEQHEGGAW